MSTSSLDSSLDSQSSSSKLSMLFSRITWRGLSMLSRVARRPLTVSSSFSQRLGGGDGGLDHHHRPWIMDESTPPIPSQMSEAALSVWNKFCLTPPSLCSNTFHSSAANTQTQIQIHDLLNLSLHCNQRLVLLLNLFGTSTFKSLDSFIKYKYKDTKTPPSFRSTAPNSAAAYTTPEAAKRAFLSSKKFELEHNMWKFIWGISVGIMVESHLAE